MNQSEPEDWVGIAVLLLALIFVGIAILRAWKFG